MMMLNFVRNGRGPLRLGINQGHFAHMLAGTPAGDHSSVD